MEKNTVDALRLVCKSCAYLKLSHVQSLQNSKNRLCVNVFFFFKRGTEATSCVDSQPTVVFNVRFHITRTKAL